MFRSHYSDGPLLVNTFCVHVDEPDLGGGPGPDDVAGAVDSWLTDKFRFAYPNSVTMDELTVTRLGTDTPDQGVRGLSGNGGITAGAQLPKEMVRVLTLKTDVATRSGRGRLFMPTPQTTASLATAEQYAVSGTWYANLQDLVAALLATHTIHFGVGGLQEADATLGVWSRRHLARYDVKSIVIRQGVHWLRSRSTSP